MSEVFFIGVFEALEIHTEEVNFYGGEHGVRDSGLLESALAAPQSGMAGEYFHADLYEMAAAYLYHIVQNHPFVDGNKRTGLACAYMFLFTNGIELECDPDELSDIVLAVANGALDKAGIAAFLRSHAVELPPE